MTGEIRRASQRGYFDYGWLKTFHTFSFGEYHDPDKMGFRSLRVINENWLNPAVGFPVKIHQDMEIFSIILEGGVSHQDSLGNGSIMRAGHIQLMSAGRGLEHSEFNASDRDSAHFYQFWITPSQKKLKPSYQSKFFDPATRQNQWYLILSKDGRKGSLQINQDVSVYLSNLSPGVELKMELEPNRYGWLQVMEGKIVWDGKELEDGDGAAISRSEMLQLKALKASRIIFFDLD